MRHQKLFIFALALSLALFVALLLTVAQPTFAKAIVMGSGIQAIAPHAPPHGDDGCESPAPANDNFSTPNAINSFPYTNSECTTNATSASTDPNMGSGVNSTCNSTASGKNSNTVWYKFKAPGNGHVRVRTGASDGFFSTYDTVVAVLTDNSSKGLVSLGCDDDSGAFGSNTSDLTVPVVGGKKYYIEVADYGLPGGGTLNLKVNFKP